MTKLEIITRPDHLSELQDQLAELGHAGITVSEVHGTGQPERIGRFMGTAYRVTLAPHVKVELVVPDPLVEEAVRTIRNACRTGEAGDGKIFASRVADCVRIRTGQRGNEAL